jgi:hypothetical protein
MAVGLYAGLHIWSKARRSGNSLVLRNLNSILRSWSMLA